MKSKTAAANWAVLMVSGMLALGLSGCGQGETPVTPPPTTGTVSVMPGQTVTGIDGVQITAPARIEGWDGKAIEVKVEAVTPGNTGVDLTKYQISSPVYKISTSDTLNLKNFQTFKIKIPYSDSKNFRGYRIGNFPAYDVGDSAAISVSEDFSSKYVNGFVEFSSSRISKNADAIMYFVSKIPEGEVKLGSLNDHRDARNLGALSINDAIICHQNFDLFRHFWNYSQQECDEKASFVRGILDGYLNEFVSTFAPTADDPDQRQFENLKNAMTYHISRSVDLGTTGALCTTSGVRGYYDPSNYTLVMCDMSEINTSDQLDHGFRILTAKHELFHAVQDALNFSFMESGSRTYYDNALIEGTARSVEVSSASRMNLSQEVTLDFTMPYGEFVYNSKKRGYPYQDFFVYLGNRIGAGYSYLEDVIKEASPGTMPNDPFSQSVFVSNDISSFGDAWWKFNLDRAIENNYPLRTTGTNPDHKCSINNEYILSKPNLNFNYDIGGPDASAMMSVTSYDTDYRHYTVTGSGTKDIYVYPDFVPDQNSLKSAVYIRHPDGACSSVAISNVNGKLGYKVSSVKAGDEILIAGGNLKSVTQNVDLVLTIHAVSLGQVNITTNITPTNGRYGTADPPSANVNKGENQIINLIPKPGFGLNRDDITTTCANTQLDPVNFPDFNGNLTLAGFKATVRDAQANCSINAQFRPKDISNLILNCPTTVSTATQTPVPRCTAQAYQPGDPFTVLNPQPDIQFSVSNDKLWLNNPHDVTLLDNYAQPQPAKAIDLFGMSAGTVTVTATFGSQTRSQQITVTNPAAAKINLVGNPAAGGTFAADTAINLTSVPFTAVPLTFTATPNDNWHVVSVTPSGGCTGTTYSLPNNKVGFKLTNLTADCTLTSSFSNVPVVDPNNQGRAEITVTNVVSRLPLSGVTFQACSTATSCQNVPAQETTSGVYNLTLPAGVYNLVVSRTGFRTAHIDNTEIVRGQTTILERHLAIDDTISGEGNITGRLVSAVNGDLGLDGVQLTVRENLNNKTGAIYRTTTTASNGQFTMTLPTGYYTVQASKQGYTDLYFNVSSVGGMTLPQGDKAMSPVMPSTGDWRIVLNWGATPYDLDSHLTGPTATAGQRFHVYYRSDQYTDSTTNVNLDWDDTSSYGPETITVNSVPNGLLRYSVHNYSNRGTSTTYLSNSGAQVSLYRGSILVKVFNVPSGQGDLWTVFTLDLTNPTQPVLMPINSITTVGSPISVQSTSTGKQPIDLP